MVKFVSIEVLSAFIIIALIIYLTVIVCKILSYKKWEIIKSVLGELNDKITENKEHTKS